MRAGRGASEKGVRVGAGGGCSEWHQWRKFDEESRAWFPSSLFLGAIHEIPRLNVTAHVKLAITIDMIARPEKPRRRNAVLSH